MTPPPEPPPAVACDRCGAPIDARRPVAVTWRKRTPLLLCAACREQGEQEPMVQARLDVGEQVS